MRFFKNTLLSALAAVFPLIAAAQDPSIESLLVRGDRIEVAQEDGYAFVEQLQPRDSILIADQFVYGFELAKVSAQDLLFMPEIRQEDEKSEVMILSPWQIDTLKVYTGSSAKGKAYKTPKKPLSEPPADTYYNIRAGFKMTSFDPGNFELPALSCLRVKPNGWIDTLVFEPCKVEIRALPVDMETFELNDIKGQITYPITFAEVLPYLLGALLLGALVWLIIWLVRRRAAKLAGIEHRDPAHIVALRKLDQYRGDKLWADDKQKLFYSGVTDALREYLDGRYGVGAMEMTTSEIFAQLKSTDIPQELQKELEELFQRADFVKFAKYVASREENAQVLPLAVRFVTTTYQVDVEAEEPTQPDEPAEAAQQEAPVELNVEPDHSKYLPKN